MKCFKKSLLAVLCCLFSLLFSISSSIPTHAIDLNPGNLDLVGWNSNPCSRLAYTVDTYIEGFSDWSRAPRYDHHKVVGYVRIGGCGETMWTVKGSFVQIIFSLSSKLASDIPTIIYPQKNGDFEPISQRITSSVDYDSGHGHLRTFEIIGKYVGVNTPSDFVIGGPTPASPLPILTSPTMNGAHSWISINSISSWVQRGDGSQSVTSELKNVGDKISSISGSTSEISQKITNTFDMIHRENQQQLQQQRATTEAVNAQTQQQKNQHDQEKKEEKDRENKGNDQSSKLSNLFSFTAFNPFSGLFGLFTSGGCKPIPTIGKMLNKPDATYCPWFPDNVRSILTPVLGISSMMLIFGFFIRWLNSDDFNGIGRNHV
jgi:hypothetical protein